MQSDILSESIEKFLKYTLIIIRLTDVLHQEGPPIGGRYLLQLSVFFYFFTGFTVVLGSGAHPTLTKPCQTRNPGERAGADGSLPRC
jgi:hypothetical protein